MSVNPRPSDFQLPGEEGTVVRMRPVHVALFTAEWSYRIVMGMLLTRRGYTVSSSSVGEARQVVERDRPDAVLLDAGESELQLERSLLLARSLQEWTFVVVAASRASRHAHGIPVLARWGPLPELLAVLARAERQPPVRR
jgi:hypothetical protein